ncbi:GNAT family N-acetyltransferase [Saxibacter everestensis]|uniref:GNAT family N-acetyltransferase n=1 Tax=Saxibacter everestensis TaxID=2909229 RepID=A0ABY8QQR6_9MICO|nr:GNAT family N-acetyltransferase [Brevibacteriaceae bacterium ZFBP1038]
MDLSFLPANDAKWTDIQTVFGQRGMASRCQCQRYKLRPGEALAALPDDELCLRLHDQSQKLPTTGLLAFADKDPVGWCAVAPRTSYSALVRNSNHTAWRERREQRDDAAVWAITCFWTRTGYRRKGVATALATAAVALARRSGAAAVEAYPVVSNDALAVEMHVGTANMFKAAGLFTVSNPSKRRCVMRLDLQETDETVPSR